MTTPAQHARMSSGWQPIAGLADVWELRRTHGALHLRAVAIELPSLPRHTGDGSERGHPDKRVCVYSPVPHAGPVAMDQLRAIGHPILLAPNAYHTLGLPGHATAFQEAPVVASEGALKRIKNKTKLSVEDLPLLEANLPPHVSLIQPPDLRSGEVWLSIRDANRCAWVVCDAFLNFPRLPTSPVGLALRLLRMGPGLAIGATFKFLVKDRRAYREWLLAKIAEERPTMLIPCHGEVSSDDRLPARLEQLVRKRF